MKNNTENIKHLSLPTMILGVFLLFVVLATPIWMKLIRIQMNEVDFNAKSWHTHPEMRYLMADDLSDRLQKSVYHRDNIIELLGEPEAQNPKRQAISWYLGRCAEIPAAYCSCWFDIEFVNDDLNKVSMLCESK